MSEAMRATLDAGGSATDALVSAFAVQAGEQPGGLFRPVFGAVTGVGAGRRAFDGRSLQPGSELARPRGFKTADEVPDAARVAVPQALSALWVMQARFGRLMAREVWGPGVLAARAAGASERSRWLREVGHGGPHLLTRGELHGHLLAVAGPVAGGCLSEADLTSPTLAEPDAEGFDRELPRSSTEHALAVAPAGEEPFDFGCLFAVAADSFGLVAGLAIGLVPQEIVLEPFGLAIPLQAAPVMRGVTRTPPGSRLRSSGQLSVFESAQLGVGVLASSRRLPSPTVEEALSKTPLDAGLRGLNGERILCARRQADRALAWSNG